MKVCLACHQPFTGYEWHCPNCGQRPRQQDSYSVFAPELTQSNGNDVEYKYAELFEVEATHYWFRARNQLLIWALNYYFPNACSFLEIGCGAGFVLTGIKQGYPRLIVSASDILTDGLTYAAKRLPDATLFQMDARCIPFEAEFDIIGAFDILGHITEDEGVLAEIFRAVKPGGGLMLTVPQHPFLWNFIDDFSHHKRHYTRPELVKKVRQADFEISRATSFVSLLFPLLSFARLSQRQIQDNFDPMAEFKINPVLNMLLENVLDIERFFIKQGFTFPLGGSLLVIAKRPHR